MDITSHGTVFGVLRGDEENLFFSAYSSATGLVEEQIDLSTQSYRTVESLVVMAARKMPSS
jgi:hypothetical protein